MNIDGRGVLFMGIAMQMRIIGKILNLEVMITTISMIQILHFFLVMEILA